MIKTKLFILTAAVLLSLTQSSSAADITATVTRTPAITAGLAMQLVEANAQIAQKNVERAALEVPLEALPLLTEQTFINLRLKQVLQRYGARSQRVADDKFIREYKALDAAGQAAVRAEKDAQRGGG